MWKPTKKRVGSSVSQKKTSEPLEKKLLILAASMGSLINSYVNRLHFVFVGASRAFSERSSKDIVCLDFSKAFDKVSHNVLVEAVVWRVEQLMDCSFNGQRTLTDGLTRRESLHLDASRQYCPKTFIKDSDESWIRLPSTHATIGKSYKFMILVATKQREQKSRKVRY